MRIKLIAYSNGNDGFARDIVYTEDFMTDDAPSRRQIHQDVEDLLNSQGAPDSIEIRCIRERSFPE